MEKTFIVSASYHVNPTEWKELVSHTITSLDLEDNEEELLLACYKHYLSEHRSKDGTQIKVLIAQEGQKPKAEDEIIFRLADPNSIIEILSYWTNCYVGTAAQGNRCRWVNRK